MTNQPTLDDACAAGLSARGRVDRAADYLLTLGVRLHDVEHGFEIRNALVKLLDAHARSEIQRTHYIKIEVNCAKCGNHLYLECPAIPYEETP